MTRKKHSEEKDKSEELKNKKQEDKIISQQENIVNEKTEPAPETVVEQPAADSSTETSKPEAEVKTKEEELQEKLAELQDKYLRLMAEFDNYRKRTLREKIELTKNAGEKIIAGIISVMDDFERALAHMNDSSDNRAMKEGIELIYNKFSDFLKQQGVREIESLNCDFNVELHEAVTKVAVEDEAMKGKVIEVLQKGYYLNDKVLRFSKVVVGE